MRGVRNRELLALLPASLLVTAGFAGVFVQRSNAISNVSLTYGAIFLALCVAGHVFIRLTLPHADPYLFPLAAVLASFGIVMVYRIDPTDARLQAQWFVLGLILFAVTIIAVRDYRKLERYRYVIMAVSLGLLVLPRLPGIGYSANGAYLGVRIPGLFVFQPAEFSKIGLVVFLASYLRDTRQVLVMGARRILGVTIPPLKHFGPVILIWGLAMGILVLLSDIGSSVMFYGGLLAVLYVATNRVSFVVVGLIAAAIGFWYLGTHIPHVHARVETWLHPLTPSLYHAPLGSYQIANSLFAQAAGGMFGQGFGEAALTIPGTHAYLLPAPQTDMIYAVITDELGLFGGGRRAAHLPAVRMARVQGRAAGARLVLDADGRRAHGHVRATGVRDRRRRHARDPAHRRDAALHLLRRVLDRGQLRVAGADPARVRPCAQRGSCGERADHPGLRPDRGAVCGAGGLHLPLDSVRGHQARQQPAQRQDADRRAEDQARADPGGGWDGAGQVGTGAGRNLEPDLPNRSAVRAGGRVRDRRQG